MRGLLNRAWVRGQLWLLARLPEQERMRRHLAEEAQRATRLAREVIRLHGELDRAQSVGDILRADVVKIEGKYTSLLTELNRVRSESEQRQIAIAALRRRGKKRK